MSDVLGWLFVAGFIALFVFVVLREFWTWYWKQSEQVELLKEIAGSLRRLEERGGTLPADHAAAVRLGLAPLKPEPAGQYATAPWAKP